MERGLTLRRGLDPAQRADAARLYWAAFGAKLGRLLGPDPRALALLDRVIRCDHALGVEDAEGRLLAVAGFRSPLGCFASFGWRDLVAIYGRLGGPWRAALLHWPRPEVDNGRFLVDGIAVHADMRGRGIGSVLLEALAAEARARGYPAVRLEVADTNPRARALYERHGFAPWREDRLRLLAPLYGYRVSTVMLRPTG